MRDLRDKVHKFNQNKYMRSDNVQNVKMQTLEFRGNHYDYGVAQAEWLKSTKMLQNREKEWRIRRPRFDINIDETKIYIKNSHQNLGRTDGDSRYIKISVRNNFIKLWSL